MALPPRVTINNNIRQTRCVGMPGEQAYTYSCDKFTGARCLCLSLRVGCDVISCRPRSARVTWGRPQMLWGPEFDATGRYLLEWRAFLYWPLYYTEKRKTFSGHIFFIENILGVKFLSYIFRRHICSYFSKKKIWFCVNLFYSKYKKYDYL